MSMTGRFLLVSDAEIDALVSSPETVRELLDRRVYEVDEPVDYVDVDKAWHALHFLLTGSAWDESPPLDFIAVGGEPIGDEDVGYGPARALRSGDVARVHRELALLSTNALVARFDLGRMDALEIYPHGWAEFELRDAKRVGYFIGAYEELRELVRSGAESGRGILIWISLAHLRRLAEPSRCGPPLDVPGSIGMFQLCSRGTKAREGFPTDQFGR